MTIRDFDSDYFACIVIVWDYYFVCVAWIMLFLLFFGCILMVLVSLLCFVLLLRFARLSFCDCICVDSCICVDCLTSVTFMLLVFFI